MDAAAFDSVLAQILTTIFDLPKRRPCCRPVLSSAIDDVRRGLQMMRALLVVLLATATSALRLVDRRHALRALTAASGAAPLAARAAAAPPSSEPETVALASGLSYQDFKVGPGSAPAKGQRVTVDYVMSTTGARYGAKIYSTKDAEVIPTCFNNFKIFI